MTPALMCELGRDARPGRNHGMMNRPAAAAWIGVAAVLLGIWISGTAGIVDCSSDRDGLKLAGWDLQMATGREQGCTGLVAAAKSAKEKPRKLERKKMTGGEAPGHPVCVCADWV